MKMKLTFAGIVAQRKTTSFEGAGLGTGFYPGPKSTFVCICSLKKGKKTNKTNCKGALFPTDVGAFVEQLSTRQQGAQPVKSKSTKNYNEKGRGGEPTTYIPTADDKRPLANG